MAERLIRLRSRYWQYSSSAILATSSLAPVAARATLVRASPRDVQTLAPLP